jgi:chromate reductase
MCKINYQNLGFPSVLAGKLMVILGVAVGSAEAIKSLEQLRCVLSQIGAIVLPGAVSVASVDNVFGSHGLCGDPTIEKRLRELVHILMDYIDP